MKKTEKIDSQEYENSFEKAKKEWREKGYKKDNIDDKRSFREFLKILFILMLPLLILFIFAFIYGILSI